MYETSLAQSSYANSTKSTADMRGVEYQIFARITRQLAATDKSAPDYFPKLTEALH
ncbi:MAG: flagellar biosynthesis regulator FlaF, partial [Hyphococcus sp.]